jgi:hypothetical protein
MPTTITDEELVLYPEMAGARMTPEDFDRAEVDPDDRSRYELIHGVLVVTPIKSRRQASALSPKMRSIRPPCCLGSSGRCRGCCKPPMR